MPDFTISSFSPKHLRSRSTSPTKRPHGLGSPPELDQYRYSNLGDDSIQLEDILLPPEPALTSYNPHYRTSISSEEPPSPPINNTLQRRFTKSFFDNCRLPPLVTRELGIFGPPSPTKRSISDTPKERSTKEESYFTQDFAGDRTGKIKRDDKGGIFDDWFRGTSTPVTLGLPTRDDPTMGGADSPPPSGKLSRKPTPQTPTPNAAASFTSKLPSFFSKSSPQPPKPSTISLPKDDEFLNLDVQRALFPPGPVDLSSPSSYQSLISNAESLLTRMQAAYRVRTIALHDAVAEKSVQQDELEEAETRARHLKMQLDDMAAKVASQDAAMQDLAAELAFERRRRHDEEEARKKSLLLIKPPADLPSPAAAAAQGAMSSESPVRRNAAKRSSRATMGSDSGFESEDDSAPSSYADSVFSRTQGAASPTPTMSSIAETDLATPSSVVPAQQQRPGLPPKQPSTFEKVLKGMRPGGAEAAEREKEDPQQRFGCANCEGGNASMAWGVVRKLRDENGGLKVRIGELEGAVEGALGLLL